MPKLSENVENNAETLLLDVTEDVEELVKEIIVEYNCSSESTVTYSHGSQAGDNYGTKTVAVDIKDDKKSHTLSLFIKYAHNITSEYPLDEAYSNEIYFFDKIAPTLLKFAEKRGLKDIFPHIPKCFGTSTKHVLALDNLRVIGYELFDRKKIMNANHIALVFKAFARYHGLCFAFKDQEREHFLQLTNKRPDIFNHPSQQNMQSTLRTMLEGFFGQLDLTKDKHILDKQQIIYDWVKTFGVKPQPVDANYAVLIKGDCWCTNMMLRYDDVDKEDPADVILLDWQMISVSSVARDISYFFYTVACDEELDKLEYYLKIYHAELTKYITDLGSDPEVLYPYSVLEQEWKYHCIFGYMMAILVINLMLIDKEDAPDLGKQEEIDIMEQFARIKTSPEYFRRMKTTDHFIKNDFF